MDWGCGDVAERGIKAMWNEPSSQSASQPTNQRASDNDDDDDGRLQLEAFQGGRLGGRERVGA